MTDYTSAFGLDTVNPTRKNYNALTLTANVSLQWPFNYSGDGYVLSAITDISASTGLTITLPNANEVSKGEDILIRNVGSFSFDLVDADAVAVATLAPGDARYIFVTDNATDAGNWEVVSFGVGASSVDAASLVGYGIKATVGTLNQRYPVSASSVGLNINDTYRASVLIHTGGTATYTTSAAATLGNDFFVMFRNDGTGSVTLDPNGSETIDSLTTMTIQPGESLIISCSGTQFYSIGHAKSTVWNFTQLIKDVSAGGTITLSATEASNKLLTFTGSPAANLTVVVPSVVNVYYIYNDLTTAKSVTVKTAAGTGVTIDQTQRIIAFCDGTDIVSAQSVVATTSVSLINGSVSAPALNFSSKTNTGIFKSGTDDLGIAVNGSTAGLFTANGLTTAASGNLTATNLNAALAELQTDIDLKANIASPTFTGTVGGITKSMVGLTNVDNTSDATKLAATIAAMLAQNNTFTKAQRGAYVALTSASSSIAVNLSLANNFNHTLTENTTLAAPTNAVAGQSGVIHFTQHASAAKTLAFNAFWQFGVGTTNTMTTTTGGTAVISYIVDPGGMSATCSWVNKA